MSRYAYGGAGGSRTRVLDAFILKGLQQYWWADLELNQDSRHYEYPALPLSYQPDVVRETGLEPVCLAAGDFKSPVYTIPPLSQIS